ncbi:hypothetical protein WICMUC_001667 [Wickerhamomyces mucosus]|uniref:Actin interacting protein 3 C-terminal domain-containing protein n=1 Tax=Wickerhamomyces mucosus TaxID=1378264 RepID=A0A9P8TGM6_9ASCO|nr:hypothetical protein WICMUC_001667 [Wickerhamomyces mucosus]
MSTIESSVTRLLVATKHLLESLTQWAKLAATETEISDAYVQLGNEFKVACRAFMNAGVDVSDLGDVPHSLRIVLEEALCESPSQESLDKFLPSIRNIIINLLQNLKNKQAIAKRTRNVNSRENLKSEESSPIIKRSSSTLTDKKTVNNSPLSSQSPSKLIHNTQQIVPQTSSQLDSQNQHSIQPEAQSTPQPKKRQDEPGNNTALAQLQKGDSLQRRASRRFSAYQYAKLTSYSPGRDPDLPDQSLADISRNSIRQSSSLAKISQPNEPSKVPTGDISIFLKIGDKVKKSTISMPPTFTSLRLSFVEKFAYSPGAGAFPDIYIQDPQSNISYELEEHLFGEIKENCVISLNVKQNNGLVESLQKTIEDLKIQLNKKQQDFFLTTKDYINESNNDILKKLQEIIESTTRISTPITTESSNKDSKSNEIETKKSHILSDVSDLLDIRHELAVIKQINTTNKNSFKKSIENVLSKVNDFKSLTLSNSKTSNRQYMEDSHSKLSTQSDNLLTRFDDLQDLIEALRKDVATRGSKPSNKQLDYVTKELNESQKDFDNLQKFISTEKPNWKKIWENELDIVCNEQQFLTLQEDLIHDLKEDFAKAYETFELVKQCCIEQTKNPKIRSANLPLAEPGNLPNLRDALLSEVEALKPNHESRVEAIERAEKLREKERLLTMMNGFEEELEGFVEENKLKKSGGIEEVERLRKLKDEENLRSNFPPPF